ncbi:MAG: hypothetical protein A2Y14_05660 [Verrucomicrobia bacterium GWF2_51_19]|nr:MAG: hypothetical protein A2Y14_05660 [Verrucomicrobia bacterium GWF2_51_19]HCJ12138.1 ABC transporter permease [Opitutae bacterium]
MPWYLYLALKNLFPSKRKVSFFSVISIVGVALGVMVLLIVQSVMNGLGKETRDKIVATDGHIRVRAPYVMYDTARLFDLLKKQPNVAGVAPYCEGMVMLQCGDRVDFPVIRGIDRQLEGSVTHLEPFFVQGTLQNLDDDSIFISAELSRRLGIYIGATVELYSPLLIQSIKADSLPLPREVTVAGVFKTGWNEIDNNTIFCTLQLTQDLYGMSHGIHGFHLRIAPGANVTDVARAINHKLVMPLHATTWLENNRDLLFLLQLEKTTMFFVILFIVIVASFSISSSLMLSVVRKTREVGLLSALGGQMWQIGTLFCLQGVLIGIFGLLLGFGGGILALTFRENIMQALMAVTHSRDAFLEFYQFSRMPVEYTSSDFIFISVFCLLLATLAGLIPALRAAKLNPSEALRSE